MYHDQKISLRAQAHCREMHKQLIFRNKHSNSPAAALTIKNLTSGILKATHAPQNQYPSFSRVNSTKKKAYTSSDDIPDNAPSSTLL